MAYTTKDPDLSTSYGYTTGGYGTPTIGYIQDSDEAKSSSEQQSLPFGAIFRLVRRKILLILLPVVALGGASYYRELQKPELYEGTFQLLIEPITAEGRLADPSAVTEEARRDSFFVDYPTQLAILRGDGLLSRVVADVQQAYPDFSLEALRETLTVERAEERRDQTRIIEVKYTYEDPDVLLYVLGIMSEVYLGYSFDERRTNVGAGVVFIESQIQDLENRTNAVLAEVQQIQQDFSTLDPVAESRALNTQLNAVIEDRIRAMRELDEQNILADNIKAQLGIDPRIAIAASVLSEDPLYQGLLTELQNINIQLALESARFDEEAPVIQALLIQKNTLTPLLKARRDETIGDSLSDISDEEIGTFQNSIRLELSQQLVAATNAIQTLEVRVDALQNTEQELSARLQLFPEAARRYTRLQNEQEVINRTKEELLARLETLRIQQAQTEVPWELVAEPSIPTTASGELVSTTERSRLSIVLGLGVGLVLGLASAFLMEKLQNVFLSRDDLTDATDLPILAEIPFPQLRSPQAIRSALSGHSASHFHSDFEHYNALYAKLLFLFPDPPIHSFAICSAEPTPYRSLIAIRLAQMIASMGKRVLIVDANLRQPNLHDFFELANDKGLADILTDSLAMGKCIQRSALSPNLFVLTAGQASQESGQLIGSLQMQQTIEKLRSAFDYVIYDAPELYGLTDTNFLATHLDGLLLVVRMKQTKQSQLLNVVNTLVAFNMPVLGFISTKTP